MRQVLKSNEPQLNAFTVDVEDYFHVSAFERGIDRSEWDAFECRVEDSTLRLIDLLAEHGVQATFFVLGWVARKFPGLVRRVAESGHEIASHGFWHRLVYNQTREEFRADICQSRDELQAITGQSVTAYRAPSFSVIERSMWALEILVEEGFRVDSSIFPVRHDRYGVADAKYEIHLRETPVGLICEFPPSIYRLSRLNVPIAGGGYFRLFPMGLVRRGWNRLAKQGLPGMFYIHPWEVDPDQPRLRVAGRLARFRHYVNLRHTEDKLSRFLSCYSFNTLSNVLRQSGFAAFAAPSEINAASG
ncbi:MAG: DUF3473 domain-containing protein [Pirellulales bacterium]|nr:DUF3473 domain-containing protein [Pirellulales bacterium]